MDSEESSPGIPCCGASLSNSVSNSTHRGGPATVLTLVPTVGSRVVLTSKQRDRDAFIWEDKETDLAYMRCVTQHMLVGDVLRETDTQFVVRFDIPHHCLPPGLRGGVASREPGAHHQCEWKEEEEEEGKAPDEEDNDDDGGNGNAEEKGYEGGEKGSRVSTAVLSRGDLDVEGDGALSKTTRFVVGIVPVLTLSRECISMPTPRSKTKIVHPLGEKGERTRSDRTLIAMPTSSPEQLLSSHSQSIGAATVQSAILASEQSQTLLRVTLSVAKRCCMSLLQSLLEQHGKLSCVSTAVACREFKLAVQHVKAVIEAQRIVAKQRRDEYKSMADSWRSSLTWVQSRPHVTHAETSQRMDEIAEERRTRLFMVFWRDRESTSCLEFRPLSSSIRNEEEQRQRGGCSNDGEPKMIESMELDPVEFDKLQALQCQWSASGSQQEFAPLYVLLSFLHFHDCQYQQSLEDAVVALTHDGTCVEAYARVMAGCMALGSEKEALVAAAIALKRCTALSPQYVRLSRVACVCAFYHRNLGEHSGVDVLPRVRYSTCLDEMCSVRDAMTLPKVHRAVRQPPTVRVRKFSYSCSAPTTVMSVVPPMLRSLLPGSSPSMDYFSRNLRARAACSFNIGDVVFCEEASIQVLLCPPIGNERDALVTTSPFLKDDDSRVEAWASCRLRFCAYCGYPLVSKQVLLAEVCENTSKALADRLRWSFNGKEPLPCAAGCGEHYCGEVCRNRAALEYHAVECYMLPVGRSDESHSRRDPADVGEAKKRVSAPPTFPSTTLESYSHLTELFPSATIPLDRPSVHQLVSIRRRGMRGSYSECEEISAESQFLDTRHGSTTSHNADRMMVEREQQYSRMLEVYRPVVRGFRAAFKSHYAAVEAAILEKAPNAMITALLLVGRIVANILSLFLPPAAMKDTISSWEADGFVGSGCLSRDRSSSIKAIVSQYVSRGFTSSGTSPSDRHDAHGLCLAEEVLHQIRVPFFADTNLAQPATVWELLGENPTDGKKVNDDTPAATAAVAATESLPRGFDRTVKLLRSVDGIIQSGLCKEVVAFSLSVSPDPGQSFASGGGAGSRMWARSHSGEPGDPRTESCSSGHHSTYRPQMLMDAGALAVWLVEERNEFRSQAPHHPSVWTFGRLLGFLGKRRLIEQLWDFCLSSHCVVPKCVLTLGVDRDIPEHHREGWERICRRYTVSVAVMSPLTSVVSDLTAVGGDVCSRFFADAAPDSPRNPLFFRKVESPATSVLSINSLTYEPDEQHSRGGAYNTSGNDVKASTFVEKHMATATTPGNLESCTNGMFNRSGERCVMMRARRTITTGEELRYECGPL
ncbi:hypothetical protein DQ04_08401010 [Trypanosoma grayi]|uniref:hypothetical protein n=1 Tax=Trypanosoma grayi TaxID=71804 RepID=UPI0004F42D2F|nr:hypothetical protein DQ04_08401010 [Trypanosoma grayi]KEG07951.1 hypothetical protein DQ04_08401010 [Trypanosoma grayi]